MQHLTLQLHLNHHNLSRTSNLRDEEKFQTGSGFLNLAYEACPRSHGKKGQAIGVVQHFGTCVIVGNRRGHSENLASFRHRQAVRVNFPYHCTTSSEKQWQNAHTLGIEKSTYRIQSSPKLPKLCRWVLPCVIAHVRRRSAVWVWRSILPSANCRAHRHACHQPVLCLECCYCLLFVADRFLLRWKNRLIVCKILK